MTDTRTLANPPVKSTGLLTVMLGMVPVPLQMFTATEDVDLVKRHQYTVAGNQVGRRDYDKKTGETVTSADIIKMVDVNGTLVPLADDEISDVTAPTNTDRMGVEIESLIPLAELDRNYLAFKVYQVRPASRVKNQPDPHAIKTFRLLTTLLAQREQAALIRFAVRGSAARYAALVPDGTLRMLHFDNEVRGPREIPESEISEGELAMASMLLDSIEVGCPPLVNTAGEALAEYLAKKAATGEVVVKDETVAETEVVDLMAALEASVAKAKIVDIPRKARPSTKSAAKRPVRKAAAKKVS